MRHIPSLDGLRGLAVGAVVAFHLGYLRGGYFGVDVFFTLSGFLITRLLLSERARTGHIDLGTFWLRRARRLLPAVLVLLGGLALFLRMDPESARAVGDLRAEAFSTLAYMANWHAIFTEHDYFGRFQPSPIGHTWSLAIEEQFYLAWPLVVVGWFSFASRRAFAGLVAVLAVASTVWMAIVGATLGSNRAYLGTDTRALAILTGAFVAVLSMESRQLGRGPVLRAAAVLAIAVLVTSCSLVDGGSPWLYHGGLALSGGASAILILVVSHEKGVVASMLGLAPLQWLGRLSYSLYLWHYPIVALASPARTNLVGWRLASLRLALSLGVAMMSYRWVESPIRYSAMTARAFVAYAGAATAVVVVAVLMIPSVNRQDLNLANDGWNPNPEAIATAGAAAPARAPGVGGRAARRLAALEERALARSRAAGLPTVLVVGDSVAALLDPQFGAVQRDLGVTVRDRGVIACNIWIDEPTIDESGKPKSDAAICPEWPKRWAEHVREFAPDLALLILGTSGGARVIDGKPHSACDEPYDRRFAERLRTAFDVLGVARASVAVTTIPRMGFWRNARSDAEVDCANAVIRAAVADRPSVRLIDLAEHICPKGVCLEEFEGVPVRPDHMHFNKQGPPWVARWILEQALARDGGPMRLGRGTPES